MRLYEFAPSPERDDSDEMPNQLLVLANRWWNATDRQPQIEHVLNSLGWSIQQVESEDDAVQLQHRDGTTYFISADDFDPDLYEDTEQLPRLINKTANIDGIQVSINTDEKNASAYATSHGRRLGYAEFDREGNTLVPYDLAVMDEYRGQGIAAVIYNYVKSLGFKIKASPDQTDDGKYFWRKNRGSRRVWESELDEISADRLERYLARADKHVSNRMDRMSQARQRLSKSYEIYHADRPAGSAQIVDRFEADTPALARQYYERFIQNYESDVDFDLRLRKATGIMEIARIPQSELGGWGDEGTITPPKGKVTKKELPGGSGFTYAVNKKPLGEIEIMIFDGDDLAGELDIFETQDPLDTWQVETVVVNKEYRGQGVGKALYGIALSILKLTLETGSVQTQHGQRMWLMLNSIPGVEVKGYNFVPTAKYQAHKGDQIITQTPEWTRYTFAVQPGKRSMRSGKPGTGLYTTQATMIAKWTGQ
jgi:GNAT superfamily N-acetyltransferase